MVFWLIFHISNDSHIEFINVVKIAPTNCVESCAKTGDATNRDPIGSSFTILCGAALIHKMKLIPFKMFIFFSIVTCKMNNVSLIWMMTISFFLQLKLCDMAEDAPPIQCWDFMVSYQVNHTPLNKKDAENFSIKPLSIQVVASQKKRWFQFEMKFSIQCLIQRYNE